MKLENYKKQKGITLIALVVTIIVLLILAGISITMLTGENGILKRASEAKVQTETAQTIEKIQLSALSALTDGLGKIKESTLEQELTNHLGTKGTDYTIEGSSDEGWIVSVPKDKVAYLISVDGIVDETEYEEPIDNSQSLVLGLVDDL